MSSDGFAIRVDHLSKRYLLGERARYRTLREALVEAARAPFRARRAVPRETLWALRDVSFEVRRGEVIGVIGRNGAGKSTLLKILSRITEPTTGRAELHGRVGSLLEVGTGFHSELTGRENVFLAGAILGMRRAEIERKFDEIVAFAEVERFVDTPVKHYSSGMYLRLAFAVAAHLEPEILLVDEVLAVGDASFQRKCLGRMGEVASEGRTVLFVSHNMSAVARLCHRGLWLDEGKIEMTGPTAEVVEAYLSRGGETGGERRWAAPARVPGNDKLRVVAVRARDQSGHASASIDRRFPFTVEIEYEVLQTVVNMQVGFWLLTSDGVVVFVAGDAEDRTWFNRPRMPGRYVSRCTIPGHLLNAGTYVLNLGVDIPLGNTVVMESQALQFHVEQTDLPAHSAHGSSRAPGVICLSLDWHVEPRPGGAT